MTVNVNETARNLADSVRRYVKETVPQLRAKDQVRAKHARRRRDNCRAEFLRRAEEIRSEARTVATPAQKTAALGTGAALLLSGMVFSVAEAAPPALNELRAVDAQPLAVSPLQEMPAEEAAPAPETPAGPAVVDGAGSTAPAVEEGPVAPVDNVYVTSPFGWRINPMTGSGLEWHTGTDFRGATGTAVKATLGGTVTEAGWHTNGGGGLRIVVDHGDGTKSTYNHLHDIWVEPGQWVDGGQIIGAVGSTGNSTGPHLHFEALINNAYVDPMEGL